MWQTHTAQIHIQSVHSMAGIAALTLYYAQFLSAAFIFLVADSKTRAAASPVHRAVGAALTTLCLFTLFSGVLSMVYRGSKDNPGEFSTSQNLLNVAAIASLIQARYCQRMHVRNDALSSLSLQCVCHSC